MGRRKTGEGELGEGVFGEKHYMYVISKGNRNVYFSDGSRTLPFRPSGIGG
jgi:hypothetical protein